MPDILHRISIDAPQKEVHDLIATTDGVARWWTGRPLDGDSAVGGRFSVYFGDAEKAAAVMEVVTDTPDEVAWLVVEGPDEWIDTLITFALRSAGAGQDNAAVPPLRLASGERVHERVQHELGCVPDEPEDRRRRACVRRLPGR